MDGRRKTSVETGSMKKKQYNFEKKKKALILKKYILLQNKNRVRNMETQHEKISRFIWIL